MRAVWQILHAAPRGGSPLPVDATPARDGPAVAAAPLNRLVRQLRQAAQADRLGDQPDQVLLERHLAGDAPAFEALVWRHGPAVLTVCRNVLGNDADAEDAF